MPNRSRRRASTARVGGRARAAYLAARLGTALGEARQSAGLREVDVATVAGVSQSFESRMERGLGSSASVETWASVAIAAGSQLAAFLENLPGATRPRDYQHLRRQQLIMDVAAPGGWKGVIEHRIGPISAHGLSIDVRLQREARREIAIVEIWDWFDDVGGAFRSFDAKLAIAQRNAAARELIGSVAVAVSGVIVVRATQRNRALLREFGQLFRSRYPGSGRAWLAAFGSEHLSMPEEPALLWTDVRGTRLFAARW
jgi:transcriptional regulator with XRE-family HTH domain